MAKILLVEDDEFFREAVSDLLKKKGHEVTEAANGKAAVVILKTQDFNVVVSDIQMPEMNGIELLDWALRNKPIPFVIMTGFSTLLETQSAYDLGAKEFISKPFKNADFLAVVNKAMGLQDKLTVVEGKFDYYKIGIEEFVSGSQIEFDVYIKLSEEKYVKIAHKGEALPRERILHYKEKNVKYLYVSKDAFSYLVGFNLGIAGIIDGDKNVSHEKKMNFLKYTGELIMAKIFQEGVDRQAFQEAENFVQLTLNALTNSRKCLDLISILNSHSDHVYAHSVGVSIYSVMIAQKMGFASNQAFFKLAMAGLFHDVGKKEIDNELLKKHRSLLNAEEKKIIDSHVLRGQEIMLSIQGIPEDVAQLVYEHHEDTAGLGFPLGKDKKNLHPLSKILQLANIFVGMALDGPDGPGMKGVDAIAHIETIYKGRFDGKAMTGLKELFFK